MYKYAYVRAIEKIEAVHEKKKKLDKLYSMGTFRYSWAQIIQKEWEKEKERDRMVAMKK